MSGPAGIRDTLVETDVLYQALVLGAVVACERWAVAQVTDDLSVLLWLRDRGDFPGGTPYQVHTQIVQRGIWRIGLQPQLPAGVDVKTRDAVLRACIADSGQQMPVPAIDQVIQCGLFGEVLYR